MLFDDQLKIYSKIIPFDVSFNTFVKIRSIFNGEV